MSAFLCSRPHFVSLAYWACKSSLRGRGAPSAELLAEVTRIARVLYAENVASVCYRYREDASRYESPEELFPDSDPSMRSEVIFAAQMCRAKQLRAAQCYAYQSCERPEWMESDAYKLATRGMLALGDALARERAEDVASFLDLGFMAVKK